MEKIMENEKGVSRPIAMILLIAIIVGFVTVFISHLPYPPTNQVPSDVIGDNRAEARPLSLMPQPQYSLSRGFDFLVDESWSIGIDTSNENDYFSAQWLRDNLRFLKKRGN